MKRLSAAVFAAGVFAAFTFPILSLAEAPVCSDVAVTTGEGVPGATVIFDCSDADGDIDRIEIVAAPVAGEVADPSIDFFGWFTGYSAPGSFFGSDFFTYRAVDLTGDPSNTATVRISVAALPEGGLTQLQGAGGYYENFNGDTWTGTGLGMFRPTSMAESPDGKHLYVVGHEDGSIAVILRNAGTGLLSQAPDHSRCVSYDGDGDGGPAGFIQCQIFPALENAELVEVSPDGENVYVLSVPGDTITVFDRNATSGALSNGRCISKDGLDAGGRAGCAAGHATGLAGARKIALSPDGAHLYVATATDTISVLSRDASGDLSQSSGPGGCFSESDAACTGGFAGISGISSLVLSPDGKFLYSASSSDRAVAILQRNPGTGALSQAIGACIGESQNQPCTAARAVARPSYLGMAPDGRTLYVADDFQALIILSRDPLSGALTQLTGTSGCINGNGADGCLQDASFFLVHDFAFDPDSRTVYANGVDLMFESYVVAFSRQTDGSLLKMPEPFGCVTNTGLGNQCIERYASGNALRMLISTDGRFAYLTLSGAGMANPGILVYPRNVTPRCTSQTVEVRYQQTAVITLSCSDPNDDLAALSIAANPVNGSLGPINGATVLYTPHAGFTGADSFTFRASDGAAGEPATVNINVVNAAPVCTSAEINIQQGTTSTIPLVCADQDGNAFTITPASQPSIGVLSSAGPESVAYQALDSGRDSFTFTASDGLATSAAATITLNVVPGSPRVTIRGAANCGLTQANPCRVRFRRPVRWEGRLVPASAAGRVKLSFQRLTAGENWQERIVHAVSAGQSGRYEASVRSKRLTKGIWRVRAELRSSAGTIERFSPWRYLRIN